MSDFKECEKTKEIILNRLFETSSQCMHCNSDSCFHTSRRLKDKLSADDVLDAINYE